MHNDVAFADDGKDAISAFYSIHERLKDLLIAKHTGIVGYPVRILTRLRRTEPVLRHLVPILKAGEQSLASCGELREIVG